MQHLALLRREGLIDMWHDREIRPGEPLADTIDENLNRADVVLLLVSSSFLASEYCYSVEMARAMERADARECIVVPVIIRSCDWQSAPFSKYLALPTDGKPVTSWTNLDDAFTDIAVGLRNLATEFANERQIPIEGPQFNNLLRNTDDIPRSANLSVKRNFSDLDRARFLEDAYEYVFRFFSNSCNELSNRHDHIDCKISKDNSSFDVEIYASGSLVSACRISLQKGAPVGSGITFSEGGGYQYSSGYSDILAVQDDGADQYLASSVGGFSVGTSRKLTFEGASEYFWGKVISKLQ